MRRPELTAAIRLVAILLAGALLAGPVAAKKEKAPAKSASQSLSATGRNNLVLAQAYLDSGKLDAASDRARAALATDSGSALAHATMAMVHAKQQDHSKAQTEFARALAIAPSNGGILNAYGAWLCERGERAKADENFRLALKDGSYATPIQPLINAGRCALLDQDWIRSEGYLRRAVVMAPRDRRLLLMLAESQLRLGRPMDARAFVQRADALGPDPMTLELAARVEDLAGDAISAARYRSRLHTEFPKFAPNAGGAGKP